MKNKKKHEKEAALCAVRYFDETIENCNYYRNNHTYIQNINIIIYFIFFILLGLKLQRPRS